MNQTPELLTCDVLYTGIGSGYAPGGVVVSAGSIAATGHPDTLRAQFPHARERYVGPVIAPAPTNAHTHLDMSAYDFRALPYFRWIPDVVLAQKDRRGAAGALRGLGELRYGRAAGVGDIVWSPEVLETLLPRDDLQGVLYFEVLAPNPAQADTTFEQLRTQVAAWRKLEREGGPRLGLSPHTPFTVSHRLLKMVSEFAAGEGLPLQIHVAEHPSEMELFQTGAGPLWEHRIRAVTPPTFAEVIGRDPAPDLTPVRYLDELGVLAHRPTLVHMVNVTDDDMARVARAGCAVVTCPRSNTNLECGRFRWADFAAQGVEIALGTDSVASGETLNIRDEVAFARQVYPQLDPRLIVRAAVKGGARVLGLPAPQLKRGDTWSPHFIWPRM